MKLKLLLLVSCFASCTMVNASDCKISETPCKKGDPVIKGKKDDISGMVIISNSRKPIKDVNVTAYLISKKEKMVSTDEFGNFVFDELKAGVYKFVFEKAGFRKLTKEKVLVKPDELFQLNIEMIESGDFELGPSVLQFTDF